jgi:hypothetical protein
MHAPCMHVQYYVSPSTLPLLSCKHAAVAFAAAADIAGVAVAASTDGCCLCWWLLPLLVKALLQMWCRACV